MKPISRAHFLKAMLAGAIVWPFAAGGGLLDDLRGDHVGWARLQTPSPWWNRHAQGDPIPMKFLRANTTLNIDSEWRAASAERLDALRLFPFLFTQEIDSIQSAAGRSNLAEYLQRGGFVLVDTCINASINPNPDACLQRQIATLATILPEAKIIPLAPTHAIYRCHFQFPNGRPPHTFHENIFDARWDKHGLYGIQIGQRLAGVITLSGLQCGWSRERVPPGHGDLCMKMLVNIYIYAMLQGN
jgi:hypothetical protein